jgi:hypothetical protein
MSDRGEPSSAAASPAHLTRIRLIRALVRDSWAAMGGDGRHLGLSLVGSVIGLFPLTGSDGSSAFCPTTDPELKRRLSLRRVARVVAVE